MQDFLQNSSLFVIWIYLCAVFMARYVIIAGSAYIWIWKWNSKKYEHLRIQKKTNESKNIKRDFLNSLSAMFIFATTGTLVIWAMNHGKTQMYSYISDHGFLYFIFSIIVFLFIHDSFFYWAHRFMHLRQVYKKVHLVHHLSTNPSPWTAFAFHPYESILEALILPLVVFILPIHLYAIVIFLIIMTIMNVIGHLGYELYPSGFVTHPIGRWNNTATHHNMHHRLTQCNYGLYFNWWDFWMKTNHPDYIQTFEKIKQSK